MNQIMQQLRRMVLVAEGTELTDGQLLEAFLRHRDEAALAALVRRHAPLVWGVCRRLLPHYHDAEDAFQATFLVLVRKAASVMPREMVANWLYGVARQTALKARATAAKRKEREKQVTEMPEPAEAEQDRWHDLRPLLEQEMSRLPDRYRAVLVLCDLQGKTRKEAARCLDVPEGTVAGRLARARGMLAKRLLRRGVTLSGGMLAVAFAEQVTSAGVPPALLSSTLKAASHMAAGRAAATGVISVRAAALAEGVVRAMTMSKAKLTLGAVLVVGALAAGLSAYAARPDDPDQKKAAPPAQPAPAVQAEKKTSKLPTTLPPVQVLAGIDKDGKLAIKTNAFLLPIAVTSAAPAKPAGGAPPKGYNPLAIGEETTTAYDLDKVKVFDARGSKLDKKEVVKRLKEETLALASLTGEPVQPQHLRLLDRDTLIFVLPAPKAAAGGAGSVPAVPAKPGPAAEGPTLKIGDAAPALTVGAWVKGDPVKKFEKGKVYVVEFWATWCGPCKAAIPHLTELAQKYKKDVTVIGVDVWEVEKPKDTSYFKKVEKFVKDMGPKMDYNVAIDGPEGSMARAWMDAAQRAGIPTTFVVNREGKVAWVGDVGELDDILPKVISNEYDMKAGALKLSKEQEKRQQLEEAVGKMVSAMKAHREHPEVTTADKALAVMDENAAKVPEAAFQWTPVRFAFLAEKGDADAYAYAREVLEGKAKEVKAAPAEARPWILSALASQIMDEKVKLKARDYPFALKLAKAAYEAKGPYTKSIQVLHNYANALYHAGDKKQAAVIARQAIDAINKEDRMPADVKAKWLKGLETIRDNAGQ
ncbi:MAG TPA: sigma-70 family RNA polymerase sigma factor [Gemmataceae bacterium]|jgi:RNA polymerase sigma factor (sigma-70 family)|nr:sigma-70 family RNA polymerase sigma factor [Gemmataceae bacterium]HZY89974.1 sigma-70 family RNA polymerase sigma factor [Gemmataceae bacterium]